MSLINNAKYHFGFEFLRIMAANPDLTPPSPSRIVGGIGPFDYSGAAVPATVELLIKIDGALDSVVAIDLSGVGAIGAVTVAELFAAINTAAYTDITASKEAVTDRLLLVAASGDYLQVYGEGAEIADIGQGLGVKFLKSDTMETSAETITNKDEEQITQTDAKGRDTEILTDGYRKGLTQVWTDTAGDYLIRQLVEGGVIDSVTGEYTVPDSSSTKKYFYAELIWARYAEGSNLERNRVGYVQQKIFVAKATFGDRSAGRDWIKWVYNVTAPSYKDASGVVQPDSKELPLTVDEYEALDVENV